MATAAPLDNDFGSTGEFPDDSFNMEAMGDIDSLIEEFSCSLEETQTLGFANRTTQPLLFDETENNEGYYRYGDTQFRQDIDDVTNGVEDITIAASEPIKVKERIGSYKTEYNGITVDFPYDPYESQTQMMEKIIDGVLHAENCLLESPTGTGKTAALLCSLLSVQQTMEESLLSNSVSISGSGTCTCNFDIYPNAYITQIMGISENEERVLKLRRCETVKEEPVYHCKPSQNNAPSPKKKLVTDIPQEDRFVDEVCEECVHKYVKKYDTESQCPKTVASDTLPKIYYATRTHSQIKQVVAQLKQSAYSNVPMTILSGRRQTCINFDPDLNPLPLGETVDDTCNELKKNYYKNKKSKVEEKYKLKTCNYFMEKVDLKSRFGGFVCDNNGEAWDIEDLVKYGKQNTACPFYGAKTFHEEAKIIFCPYNYLLYPWIRKAVEINPENNVIVFDEAHNIEQICRDVGSISIKEHYVNNKIIDSVDKQLEYMMSKKLQKEQEFKLLEKYKLKLLQLASWIRSMGQTIPVPKSKQEALQSYVEINLETLPSSLANITFGPKDIDELRSDVEYMKNAEQTPEIHKESHLQEEKTKITSDLISFLDKICYTLNMLYRNLLRTNESGEPQQKKKVYDYCAVVVKHSGSGQRITFELRLICLNPAITFRHLKSARTIIVASGTLSPIDSFESELGTLFKQKLSAKHVISSSQIWVGMLSHFLKFQMENQRRIECHDMIGLKILETCRIVPHGVLVFFPSYTFLRICVERWKRNGLWKQLEERKEIFLEKSGSSVSDFKLQMDEYRRLIFESSKSGCLLFAVFRGTISEGVDFKDEQARAVITIGIPHLPIGDPEVKFKRRFNDLTRAVVPEYLSGNAWYNTQAFRALNQAFGRCLRHKGDWGALILLDERLIYPCNKTQLSMWIQDFIKIYVHTKQMNSSLSNFIANRQRAEQKQILENQNSK